MLKFDLKIDDVKMWIINHANKTWKTKMYKSYANSLTETYSQNIYLTGTTECYSFDVSLMDMQWICFAEKLM